VTGQKAQWKELNERVACLARRVAQLPPCNSGDPNIVNISLTHRPEHFLKILMYRVGKGPLVVSSPQATAFESFLQYFDGFIQASEYHQHHFVLFIRHNGCDLSPFVIAQ
jgi:hypothetical protein